MEDVEKKQRELLPLLEKLQKASGEEAVKIGKQIEAKAKELEKAARNLAAAITPVGPRNEGGETRVVLTKDQRERIVAQTGVGLEVLVIDKDVAGWDRKMPGTQKRIIEQKALEMAAQTLMKQARKKAGEDLIKIFEKEIPDPVPEVQEVIDILKKEGIDGLPKLAERQRREGEAALEAQKTGGDQGTS